MRAMVVVRELAIVIAIALLGAITEMLRPKQTRR